MSLKDIISQDKAIDTLELAYNGQRIPHAYIFAGREGVGKELTARQWAKLLLCESPRIEGTFADSCDKCNSCILFEGGSHPDFQHVYKELIEFTEKGKGKTVPVEMPIDVIREFVIEKVSARPSMTKRRVFTIAECEKLNIESQNALLKVLEEPPSYCHIILICTKPEKLLPTIRSRCQVLRFGPMGTDVIQKRIADRPLSERVTRYLAALSQGSLGIACQLADLEAAGANIYALKQEIIQSLADYKYENSLDLAEQFLKHAKALAEPWAKASSATSKKDISRRAVKIVLTMILTAFHDAMRLPYIPREQLTNADQFDLITRISSRFDPENSAQKVTLACNSLRWVDFNVNETLIFEHLLLNLEISGKILVS